MAYRAIAMDGDGTVLEEGKMSQKTVRALEKARSANLFLFLVTGETGQELTAFPHLHLFHLVVAENGAVLLSPTTGTELVLGEAPPRRLVQALRDAGVKKLTVGNSIISADISDEEILRRKLDRLQLDWRIVRNRRDVMILPDGIDKASGLNAALREMNLSPRDTVAIGDAENDGPMLRLCGLGIAVGDAVPFLKRSADRITDARNGLGVAESIDNLLAGKLEDYKPPTAHALS